MKSLDSPKDRNTQLNTHKQAGRGELLSGRFKVPASGRRVEVRASAAMLPLGPNLLDLPTAYAWQAPVQVK